MLFNYNLLESIDEEDEENEYNPEKYMNIK